MTAIAITATVQLTGDVVSPSSRASFSFTPGTVFKATFTITHLQSPLGTGALIFKTVQNTTIYTAIYELTVTSAGVVQTDGSYTATAQLELAESDTTTFSPLSAYYYILLTQDTSSPAQIQVAVLDARISTTELLPGAASSPPPSPSGWIEGDVFWYHGGQFIAVHAPVGIANPVLGWVDSQPQWTAISVLLRTNNRSVTTSGVLLQTLSRQVSTTAVLL
jgi:hypothetical protein